MDDDDDNNVDSGVGLSSKNTESSCHSNVDSLRTFGDGDDVVGNVVEEDGDNHGDDDDEVVVSSFRNDKTRPDALQSIINLPTNLITASTAAALPPSTSAAEATALAAAEAALAATGATTNVEMLSCAKSDKALTVSSPLKSPATSAESHFNLESILEEIMAQYGDVQVSLADSSADACTQSNETSKGSVDETAMDQTCLSNLTDSTIVLSLSGTDNDALFLDKNHFSIIDSTEVDESSTANDRLTCLPDGPIKDQLKFKLALIGQSSNSGQDSDDAARNDETLRAAAVSPTSTAPETSSQYVEVPMPTFFCSRQLNSTELSSFCRYKPATKSTGGEHVYQQKNQLSTSKFYCDIDIFQQQQQQQQQHLQQQHPQNVSSSSTLSNSSITTSNLMLSSSSSSLSSSSVSSVIFKDHHQQQKQQQKDTFEVTSTTTTSTTTITSLSTTSFTLFNSTAASNIKQKTLPPPTTTLSKTPVTTTTSTTVSSTFPSTSLSSFPPLSLTKLASSSSFSPPLPSSPLSTSSSKPSIKTCPNPYHSLLGDLCPEYLPNFALHGTADRSIIAQPYTKLKQDLISMLLNPPITKPDAALCITADVDNWVVQLFSLKAEIANNNNNDNINNNNNNNDNNNDDVSELSPYVITSSQLVLNLIEVIYELASHNTPSNRLLMVIENQLKLICSKSRVLARYIELYEQVCPQQIARLLGFDVSDLPLLLAVAGVHSPNVLLNLNNINNNINNNSNINNNNINNNSNNNNINNNNINNNINNNDSNNINNNNNSINNINSNNKTSINNINTDINVNHNISTTDQQQ